MPVLYDLTKLTKLLKKQNNCKLCDDASHLNKFKVVCDICSMWICLDCSEISEAMYEFADKAKAKLNFVCADCETELPKVRDLINIKQNQDHLAKNMIQINNDVETNKTEQERENREMKKRLDKIEEVIRIKQLDHAEFPPLSTIVANTNKLQENYTKQAKATKKLGETVKKQEEQKQRASKKASLIVYGVTETHTDNTEQMKTDFATIKQLYSDRVNITTADVTNILRLGPQKPNQIRPIKITFNNMEKRMKVLTNNQGLMIEDEELDMCAYSKCSDPGKHTHVYITTDKTKQERDEESNLRQQLSDRREAGEQDLIIRRGKIVKKSEVVLPRWTDIASDV